jgi:membrane protease YdiL (CAAX protease family)
VTVKRNRRVPWPWLSLLPLGLGSWVPVMVGMRCGVRRWIALGVLWSMLALAGWIVASIEPSTGLYESLAVVLLILAWVGGGVTSFAIRASYEQRIAGSSAQDAGSADGRRIYWPWLSLLPFGLGAWAPIVAGVRCGVKRWIGFGVLWSGLALAGWIAAAVEPSGGQGENIVGGLIVAGWMGGVITSFAIRPGYKRRVGGASRERAPWPEPTRRSREWSLRYALTAYVVTFVGVNAVAAALYFGLGVRLRVGVGVLLVDAVLLGSLVPLSRSRGLARQDLGLRAAPAVRSVALTVVAFMVYALVAGVWIVAVHPHDPVNTLASVRNQSTINVVLAIVAIAVSAPIVEEIFFRGLLYRSLRNQLSILPAALIAGALFGLVHITSYPLATLPIKAVFGVITCLLYERTGSLLPGIGLHSFVDASAIDVALTGNDTIVLVSFSALVLVLLIRTVALAISKKERPVQLAVLGDQGDDLDVMAHPPATIEM